MKTTIKSIQLYTCGCPNCKRVERMLDKMNLNYELFDVTILEGLMHFSLMVGNTESITSQRMPALVVNNAILYQGKEAVEFCRDILKERKDND